MVLENQALSKLREYERALAAASILPLTEENRRAELEKSIQEQLEIIFTTVLADIVAKFRLNEQVICCTYPVSARTLKEKVVSLVKAMPEGIGDSQELLTFINQVFALFSDDIDVSVWDYRYSSETDAKCPIVVAIFERVTKREVRITAEYTDETKQAIQVSYSDDDDGKEATVQRVKRIDSAAELMVVMVKILVVTDFLTPHKFIFDDFVGV